MRSSAFRAIVMSSLLALTGFSICVSFCDSVTASDDVVVIVPPQGLSEDRPIDLILGFEAVSAEVNEHEQSKVFILLTDATYESTDLFSAAVSAIGPGFFIDQDQVDEISPRPSIRIEIDMEEDDQPDLCFLFTMLDYFANDEKWRPLTDTMADIIEKQRVFFSKLIADSKYEESKTAEVSVPKEDEPDMDISTPCPVILESEEDEGDDMIPMSPMIPSFWLPTSSHQCGEDHVSLPPIGRGTVF